MRICYWGLIGVLSIASLGCGEGESSVQVQAAPHGGGLIRLPRNHGYVSVKTESPTTSKGTRTKKQAACIVAHFYQPDGTTSMSPPPTDVVFKIGDAPSSRVMPLEPDPQDPTCFISKPSQFPGGLYGAIQAKINGDEVEESFSAR